MNQLTKYPPNRRGTGDDIVEHLTPRERQVVERLACGLTTKQVADQLSIAEVTVRTHIKNVCATLDLSGVRALIAWSAVSVHPV